MCVVTFPDFPDLEILQNSEVLRHIGDDYIRRSAFFNSSIRCGSAVFGVRRHGIISVRGQGLAIVAVTFGNPVQALRDKEMRTGQKILHLYRIAVRYIPDGTVGARFIGDRLCLISCSYQTAICIFIIIPACFRLFGDIIFTVLIGNDFSVRVLQVHIKFKSRIIRYRIRTEHLLGNMQESRLFCFIPV